MRLEEKGRKISIHAPRGGSDSIHSVSPLLRYRFQSTLPVGGATCSMPSMRVVSMSFQSTLPVGGATKRAKVETVNFWQFQSTLPVGGATFWPWGIMPVDTISIHAPRGGSDDKAKEAMAERDKLFQSTLPVGGATRPVLHRPGGQRLYFNPRSPWGERPQDVAQRLPVIAISIHAPRGGSDRKCLQTSER